MGTTWQDRKCSPRFSRAVVGAPDDSSGERVVAYVVKQDENLTEDMVRAFAKEHLAAYKAPKQVIFRTELPKTNVGKILRRELRAEAMAAIRPRDDEKA